jgi:excisionase family DNA binding protein
MAKNQRRPAPGDSLYDPLRKAARRLTIGVPLLHRLIDRGVIPTQTFSGRRKIAKLVVGQLLASAYEIWPPERRPHYSVEELRRLGGITVEEVASLLGLGRTSAYEVVRNRQIPARKLPSSDRWIIPEDVIAQIEAYDIGNLAAAALDKDRRSDPLKARELADPAIDCEACGEDIDPGRRSRRRPLRQKNSAGHASPGCIRFNRGAGLRKAQARYSAQCRAFRRSIVVLIRSWVRTGIVTNLNQVAVELDRRAVPQLRGEKGWQGNVVAEMLRQEAPNLLTKLSRRRPRYLTVPELARKLGVTNDQVYYAVNRGTLGCRRFGRKIVFAPDVVERAVRALQEDRAESSDGRFDVQNLGLDPAKTAAASDCDAQRSAGDTSNILTAKDKSR